MSGTFFSQVICLAQSGSTNDDAFTLLEAEPSCLVWTTDQTAGRGSRGRSWISPAGSHLAMTLAFDTAGRPDPGELCYPLLAAVAVYDTLKRLLPEADLTLKWPNDVLLAKAKLAGILCESRWVRNKVRVAIGIGINLRRHPAMDQLPKGYAALDDLNRPPSADTIVQTIGQVFPVTLDALRKPNSLNDAWLSRCGLKVGTPLRLQADGAVLEGKFAGLAADGALKLQQENRFHLVAQSCEDFDILDGLDYNSQHPL
ncbi:MAG: biotin--[acetyl-CoA-carboxylase] ligase [Acidobacteriota bacterium]|nr:biotin--[acetyl-CoA-carboxylase] ligase [Acidobacteriota bacterium]